MEITGKVAIVTGGSRGLGRQIALELGRRGARVVIAARTVTPRSTLPGTIFDTVDSIKAAGGDAIAVQCDVSEPADLRQLIEETVKEFGRLDIVINNAADMVGQELEPMVEAMLGRPRAAAAAETGTVAADPLAALVASWENQFAINVRAPFLLMMLAIPEMRANGGGVIVNISSDAAEIVPVAGLASLNEAKRASSNPSLGYAATKAALNRMTNKAAADFANDNVAIVAISPGPIRTELAELMSENGMIGSLDGFATMAELAAAVLAPIEAADPMEFSGQILRVPASPS